MGGRAALRSFGDGTDRTAQVGLARLTNRFTSNSSWTSSRRRRSSASRVSSSSIRPANGTNFTLKEAQELVGGLIEVFPLGDGRFMVCNEEGKLERLPVNVEATIIFRRTYGPGDTVVGDALVCRSDELR